MQKRTLGRTGLEVSEIGIGLEHVALEKGNPEAVFDAAVAGGVNYIDLVFCDPLDAHADHWDAIKTPLMRHREALICCLHWGWLNEPVPQCERNFEAAVDRCGGYAEIAMMQIVDSREVWENWAQKSLEKLRRFQDAGSFGFVGLSSHNVDIARAAAESGLIDVIMFPINLYQYPQDANNARLLETCADEGVAVVAMKPYYGGKLLTVNGAPTGISAHQCLHYVLSQKVCVALPGPRNVQELNDALAYKNATQSDLAPPAIGDELVNLLRGQCTLCCHCLPCPVGINIPGVVTNVNYLDYYSGSPMSADHNREVYRKTPVKASECTECAICEERCPFDVEVVGKMHRAVELFETAS